MKTALKVLGVIVVLVLVTGGLGALFLERLLPPEKLRALVVENAEKHLKRKVRLEEIKVGLVFGVRVKGLDVEGLASARQLTLRPSWRALLRRELVIASASIEGLKLVVPKSTTAQAAEGKTPAGAAPAAGAVFAVKKASLRDAEITGDGWTLRKLDADARDISPDKPFPVKAAFDFQDRRISIDGAVDPAKQAADAQVAVSGLASGRVAGDASAADFDLTVEALSIEELAKLGVQSPAALPATKAKGRVELAKEGPRFPKLGLSNEWGTVEGAGDLRRAEARLKLSLPAIKELPPLKVDGVVKVNGDDVEARDLDVVTPWGTARVDAKLPGARRGEVKPDGTATFDLDVPAFNTERLPGYAFPAAKLAGRVSGTLERAKLENVRVKTGGTDLQADGWVSRKQVELTLKCRSFVLEELTPIAPATRELKLAGKGMFALVASGALEKPLLAGKLQFGGLGAEVSGLKLAGFGGTATFDEKRIDIPNLRGTLDGSALAVDFTVKDYARAPAFDVEAELDRLDLGKLLAAQAQAKAAPAAGPASAEPVKSAPVKAKGKLLIKKLVHPNAEIDATRLAWELEGIAPGNKTLSGWARLSAGPGRLKDLEVFAKANPVVKVLLIPVRIAMVAAKVDLNNIDFSELAGDYAFTNGVMRFNDSRLVSGDVVGTTKGTVNLPTEALDLVATTHVRGFPPVNSDVTGTISDPKIKVRVLEAVGKAVGEAAKEGAKKLLDGLLKQPR